MNPEKQRIAIAQACGWTDAFPTHRGGLLLPYKWFNTRTGEKLLTLPNYLSDLNAMHEAEKTLGRDGESHEYWKNLCEACHYAWDGNCMWAAVFATAAQRAEAFLRTLNLWTE